MEYKKWENFAKVIDKAMLACKNSGYEIIEHFPKVRKMINMPKNAEKSIKQVEDEQLKKLKDIKNMTMLDE